jgi:serine/threonine-protein kinase
VIHRDIKPENILLHDGSALIADFGIALAVTGAAGTRMTETGMSLGTPHYMSPEQAMGEREITARSDVYALGAVLYEMLSGEPPFTGPTAQAIVARVVTEEPRPLGPRRRSIPPNVEAAVMIALDKLPADRFASAAEFAAALADTSLRGPQARSNRVAARTATRSPRALRALAMTGGALLVGAAGFAAARSSDPPPAPVIRYGVSLPDGLITGIAVPSPDGSRIAIMPIPTDENSPDAFIKARGEYDPRPLAGLSGSLNVVWSPDGQWLGFTSGDDVRKIPLAGGDAVTLADSSGDVPGLAWLDDDTIVYVGYSQSDLWQVPASGGTARRVLQDSAQLAWPSAVPGANAVLYTRCSSGCDTGPQEVAVLDLESGTARVVVNAARAWYTEPGALVYVRRDGGVFAAPFDRKRLDTAGAAVQLAERAMVINGMYPIMGIGREGTLVFRRGSPLALNAGYEMVWVDRTGLMTPVDSGWTFDLTDYGDNYGWSLSPDGRRLAVGLSTNEGDDVWVKQLPDGPLSRVSFDTASEYRPRWMPDGRLMFASDRRVPGGADSGGLYARRADGTGRDSLIVRATDGVFEGQWSPDGRWLVYRTGGVVSRTGGRDIVALRAGIDTAPIPLIATRYDEEAVAISPDGRWLAYESNETGRTEVFLRPFPEVESGKWQVSNGGGVAPLWSRDGRELFYMNPAREMMAVPFAAGAGEPRLGARERLFRLDQAIYMTSREFYTPYDVAPDGRFIMARRVAPPEDALAQSPLIVVENWASELRERFRGK